MSLSNANMPNIWREAFLERQFNLLLGVSHFAPLQRPGQFNKVMLAFLDKVPT